MLLQKGKDRRRNWDMENQCLSRAGAFSAEHIPLCRTLLPWLAQAAVLFPGDIIPLWKNQFIYFFILLEAPAFSCAWVLVQQVTLRSPALHSLKFKISTTPGAAGTALSWEPVLLFLENVWYSFHLNKCKSGAAQLQSAWECWQKTILGYEPHPICQTFIVFHPGLASSG